MIINVHSVKWTISTDWILWELLCIIRHWDKQYEQEHGCIWLVPSKNDSNLVIKTLFFLAAFVLPLLWFPACLLPTFPAATCPLDSSWLSLALHHTGFLNWWCSSHPPLSHGPTQPCKGKEQINQHCLVNCFPSLSCIYHYGKNQFCAAETSHDGILFL